MSQLIKYACLLAALLTISQTAQAVKIDDASETAIEQAVFTEYGYYDAAEIEKRVRQWGIDQPMPLTSVLPISTSLCSRSCDPQTSNVNSTLPAPTNLAVKGYQVGRNQYYPHVSIQFDPVDEAANGSRFGQIQHYLVSLAYGNTHIDRFVLTEKSAQADFKSILQLRDLPANDYFVQVKAVYYLGESDWTLPYYFSIVDDVSTVAELSPSELHECLLIDGYQNTDLLKNIEQLSCNGLTATVGVGDGNLTDADGDLLIKLYGLRQLKLHFMNQLTSVEVLNLEQLPHLSWFESKGSAMSANGLRGSQSLDTVIFKSNSLNLIPEVPVRGDYLDFSDSAIVHGGLRLMSYPRKVVKINNNPLNDDFFKNFLNGGSDADRNIEILDVSSTAITQISDFYKINNLKHLNINDTLLTVNSTVDIDSFKTGLCGLQMDNTQARLLQGFRPIQFLSIKNNAALHKIKSMNNMAGAGEAESYLLPNFIDLTDSNSMQCEHMYNLFNRWDRYAHVNMNAQCPVYENIDSFAKPTECRPNRLLSMNVFVGPTSNRRYITWEKKPNHDHALWGVTSYQIAELSASGEELDVHHVAVDEPQPFVVYSLKAERYTIRACTDTQCSPIREATVDFDGLAAVENAEAQWNLSGDAFVLLFDYPQSAFNTPFGKPDYFTIAPQYTQLPGTPGLPQIEVNASNISPWESISIPRGQYLGNTFEIKACREDIGCGAAVQVVASPPGDNSGLIPEPQWSAGDGVQVTGHTRIELNWNWGGQATDNVSYIEVRETQPLFKVDALVTDENNFGFKEIYYYVDKIDEPLILNRPIRGKYDFQIRSCQRDRVNGDVCSEFSDEFKIGVADAIITRAEVTIDPDTGPESNHALDTGTLKKPKSMRLLQQAANRWYLNWDMHTEHYNSGGLKPDYFHLRSLSSSAECRLPGFQRIRDFKVNYGDGRHNQPMWDSFKKCNYINSASWFWTVQSCVNGAGCTLPVRINEEPNTNLIVPIEVEESRNGTDGPGALNPGSWWHPDLAGIGWQFFWANQAAETGRVMYGNTYDLVAYWYTFMQIGDQWTPVWFEAKLKRADNQNYYEGFLQFHDRRSGVLEEVNVGTLKVFTNLNDNDNRYIDLNISITDNSIMTQIDGIDTGPYELVNPDSDTGELKIRLNDFAIEIIGPNDNGTTPAGRFGLGNDADHYSGIWQTQTNSDADPTLTLGTWIERGLEFNTVSTHDSQGLPIWFNAQSCDGDYCRRPSSGFFKNYIADSEGDSLSWVRSGFNPLSQKPLNFNLGGQVITVGKMARCFSTPEDHRNAKLWVSINDSLSDGSGYNRGINLNYGGAAPTHCGSWPNNSGNVYKKASYHGIQFTVVQEGEELSANECDPDNGACLLTISWYTDDDFPAIEPKFSVDGSQYLPLNSIVGCENLPTVDPYITREFECEMTYSGEYDFQLHKPSYENPTTESVAIAQSETLIIADCNNPNCENTLDLSSEPPSTEALPALEPGYDTVGLTLSQFNVDQMGQAGYAMPILTGTGTGGLAPEVSLQYSSSGNNGHVGVGWSISGVTVISRCRQTQESRDGIKPIDPSPITYGEEDRFCLNGERLFAVNGGKYGADGTEYRTEKDQMARITSYGQSSEDPDYFTVERRDGSLSFYGNTTDSRVVIDSNDPQIDGRAYAWAINRYEDNMGNYITYQYDLLPDTEFVLTDINYTGNDSVNPVLAPYNNVHFVYENRVDDYDSYLGGVKYATTRRLAQIQSSIDGIVVRDYTLDYAYSATTSRSILRSIQECRLSKCLPINSFDWSEPDERMQTSSTGANLDFPRDIKSSKLGDINADGRADLVFVDEDSNRFKIAYGNGHSGFGVVETSNVLAPAGDEIDNKWHLLDYNADGRQDLMKQDGLNWNIYLATGGASGISSSPTPTGLSDEAGRDFQVNDVNGDGLADLLYATRTNGLAVRYLQRANDGYEFSANLITIDLPNEPSEIPGIPTPVNFSFMQYRFFDDLNVEVRTHDINGDGVADLFLKTDVFRLQFPNPTASNTGQPYKFYSAGDSGSTRGEPLDVLDSSHWVAFIANGVNKDGELDYSSEKYYIKPSANGDTDKIIKFVDVNADGLTDVLNRTSVNNWQFRLSNGAGFNTPVAISSITEDTYLQIFDYNLDGYMDLIYPSANGNQNYFAKVWQGDAFSSNAVFTGASALNVDQNLNLFMDINGDGATDHIRVGSNGKQNIYPRRDNFISADKVTAITNGYDARTEILYRPLTFSSTYIQGDHQTAALNYGLGSPVLDVMGAIYVVREVKTDAPVEGNANQFNSARYRYENARVQTGGRGFLGFEKVRKSTPSRAASDGFYSTIEVETVYRQDHPYTGMPDQMSTFQLEEDYYASENVPPVCGTDDSCFPPPCEPGQICNILPRSQGPSDGVVLLSNVVYELDQINTSLRTSFPYVKGMTHSTFAPETGDLIKQQEETTTHDAYGNPLVHTQIIKNGQSVALQTNTITNTYTNIVNDEWLIGLMETSQTRYLRAGQASQTASVEYDYNYTNGLLTEERNDKNAGDALFLRTLHEYDDFGNQIKRISCSGATLNAMECSMTTPENSSEAQPYHIHRYERTEYDRKGRYVIKTFNSKEQQLSHVTAFDVYGNPRVSVDMLGRATTNRYDTFGRLSSTRNTLGEWKQTSRQWCSDISQQDALACPAGMGLVFRVRTLESGGKADYTYVDLLGREVVTINRTLNPNNLAVTSGDDRYVVNKIWHDRLGRKIKIQENHFLGAIGEDIPVSQTKYDRYNRPVTYQFADNTEENITYNGYSMVYENALGQRRYEVKNALGHLVLVNDYDQAGDVANYQNTMSYEYNSLGELRKVTRTSDGVTELLSNNVFDIRGRKINSDDMDSGARSVKYNALGEIIETRDAKNQLISTYRDSLGRVIRNTSGLLNSSGFLTEAIYTYDSYDGYTANGLLLHDQKITVEPNQVLMYEKSHFYDSYYRPQSTEVRFTDTDDVCASGECVYSMAIYYDKYSRIKYQQDASGKAIQNYYNTTGFLSHISKADNENKEYYRIVSTDKWNKASQDRKGGSSLLSSGYYRHPMRGWNTQIVSAFQQYSYEFDVLGNLQSRRQSAIISGDSNHLECFEYDRLNRLTLAKTYSASSAGNSNCLSTSGIIENAVTAYDGRGNLTLKDGFAYDYYSLNESNVGFSSHQLKRKGNQVLSYDANGNNVLMTNFIDGSGQQVDRNIAYTAFDKIKRVWTVNNSNQVIESEYRYDSGEERYYRKDTSANNETSIIHFIGNVEIAYSGSGPAAFRRHLGDYAVITEQGPSSQVQYLFKDHLGSVDVITNDDGDILQRMSFTAWGERRNPVNHVELLEADMRSFTSNYTTAGFTGHEMIDAFGLVNMSGRIYDAALGRMLQADPVVQDPNTSQSFNRYTYVHNNPLSFTDPSGYFSLRQLVSAIVGVVLAVVLPGLGWSAFWTGFASGFASSIILTGNLKASLKAGLISGALFFAQDKFSSAGGADASSSGGKEAAGGAGDAVSSTPLSDAAPGALTTSGGAGLFNGVSAFDIVSQVISSLDPEAGAALGFLRNGIYSTANNKFYSFGGVVQNLVSTYGKMKASAELERFAMKNGLTLGELNLALISLSYAGNKLVGTRFYEDEFLDKPGNQGVEGILSRKGGTGIIDPLVHRKWNRSIGLIFDTVDIALGFQGLITASGYEAISYGDRTRNIGGFSLGSMDANNLVARGYFPSGTSKSLVFGNVAHSNVKVEIGALDIVNGGFLGKILNPFAKLIFKNKGCFLHELSGCY